MPKMRMAFVYALAKSMKQKYRVRDNGIRCFVPPCFSWDAVSSEDGTLTKVSRILYRGQPADDDILRQLAVVGIFVEATIRASGEDIVLNIDKILDC